MEKFWDSIFRIKSQDESWRCAVVVNDRASDSTIIELQMLHMPKPALQCWGFGTKFLHDFLQYYKKSRKSATHKSFCRYGTTRGPRGASRTSKAFCRWRTSNLFCNTDVHCRHAAYVACLVVLPYKEHMAFDHSLEA